MYHTDKMMANVHPDSFVWQDCTSVSFRSTQKAKSLQFVSFLQDAYAAFEEKVCIKDFPVKHSSAHNMANSTVCVIERLMRYLSLSNFI